MPENENDIDVIILPEVSPPHHSGESHLPKSPALRARSHVGIVAARDKPDMNININNKYDDDDGGGYLQQPPGLR